VDHDAIVIGAGHNGLICAAYLARAGLDTLLLEARDTVGGCASTVDALGARVNICNCDHTLIRTTPVIDELDLASFGLSYLEVDPGQLNLLHDGRPAWPLFHDPERTVEALAATYPDAVDGYRRYVRTARPVAELVVELANEPPTPRRVAARVVERSGRGLQTLLAWRRRTVAEVLRGFFDDDALVAPAIAVGPAVWGLSPHSPRTGLGALTYAMKHVAAVGRPVGGSGGVPDAVRDSFVAAGGTLRTGARVTEILCDAERVRGVRVGDGEAVVEAPLVVSACDPHHTFVGWLHDPPPVAHGVVERWRSKPQHEGYESKLDLVIRTLPSYPQLDPALPRRLGFEPLDATAVIAPGVEELAAAHAAMHEGRVAERPILFANLPSVLDATLRPTDPPGSHVLSLEVLYTPYRLRGGWPDSTEPQRWLDVYAQRVESGFLDGVVRQRLMCPETYEREFNLVKGYAPSFAGGPLAALRGRDRELTRYETPIRGLYLTGAATFPGAGIWGASGRNAARVILAAHA
jgi:phytoene dehydrogenase-like protein